MGNALRARGPSKTLPPGDESHRLPSAVRAAKVHSLVGRLAGVFLEIRPRTVTATARSDEPARDRRPRRRRRSDREFARPSRGTYWPGHRRAAGPARPSSEWLARILATARDELVVVFDDVKPLGMQAALGQGRRDDRPARAHRVHDLGRVAGPVERMVDAVGNQADVKRLIVARDLVLRAPAQGVNVGAGQEPGTGFPPGLPTASRTCPTTTIDASGKFALSLSMSSQSTRSSSEPT